MFATVIVPLDGSSRAEIALPYAIAETGRHGARLHLVRVIPRPEPCIAIRNHGGPVPPAPRWSKSELVDDERQSIAYLRDVCRRFGLAVNTSLVVAVGEPVARLLAEAGRQPRPLLVLTSGDAADPCSSFDGLAGRLWAANAVPVLAVQQPQVAASKASFVADRLPDRYSQQVVSSGVEPALVPLALLEDRVVVGT